MGTDNFDETVPSIFNQEGGAGNRFLQATGTLSIEPHCVEFKKAVTLTFDAKQPL
jgi:hypothetical protein